MSDADETTTPAAPQVDPQQVQLAVSRLRSQQNLAAGVLAGVAAAALGAAVWAVITVTTGFQIGWMAIGVGFLVGFAIRFAGKGIDQSFGIAGAVLSLAGCAAGNLLAVCGFVAQQEAMAYMDVVARLDLELAQELMVATFSPMDVVFYAIAVYEGYKLSFREVTPEELGVGPRISAPSE